MSESSTDSRSSDIDAGTSADGDVDPDDLDAGALLAELERLREENRRLRKEHRRAHVARYRRTAVGLGAVGLVGIAAAALFPAARSVLLALGATGVFGAILTYYLTPERFIAASVGERAYAALADNEASLVGELGLSDRRLYVPTGGDPPARLFVPQRRAYELPDDDALAETFVVTDDPQARGVAFTPTGAPLFREFDRTRTGPLADAPADLTAQLTDALAAAFELVEGADADVEPGRATVEVTGNAYGRGRFDDPTASFLAVGLARGLSTPVAVETAAGDGDDALTITCRWDAEESVGLGESDESAGEPDESGAAGESETGEGGETGAEFGRPNDSR